MRMGFGGKLAVPWGEILLVFIPLGVPGSTREMQAQNQACNLATPEELQSEKPSFSTRWGPTVHEDTVTQS